MAASGQICGKVLVNTKPHFSAGPAHVWNIPGGLRQPLWMLCTTAGPCCACCWGHPRLHLLIKQSAAVISRGVCAAGEKGVEVGKGNLPFAVSLAVTEQIERKGSGRQSIPKPSTRLVALFKTKSTQPCRDKSHDACGKKEKQKLLFCFSDKCSFIVQMSVLFLWLLNLFLDLFLYLLPETSLIS